MENNYNFSYAEDEIFDEDIVGDEEEEIVAIVPMGPILGSESEVAEYYLKEYGRQKDFDIKKYHVEYHKNLSSNSCEHPQKEDPTMFIQPLINVDSNCLCGIFWMTGNQILMWSHYSDVILYDNTSRTNKYNYPLSLFIIVDNEGKSYLGAKSYEWVFQQILDATGIEPRVIITDMDPAVDATCQSVYKSTYHIHYIWHLSQNLPKHLKSKLGRENYKKFIHDFWKAQNSLSVNVFE
ncbi:protein FAR1-RELATED SEQUENCE 5-like [Rhizophagus irregularis DAOM 181602=DAOM 197198]|nr:protein FAR1-RELATED SEQUENCE 5-like [Rhizophagus irregularis DAOM 181602=DAOM 197198]